MLPSLSSWRTAKNSQIQTIPGSFHLPWTADITTTHHLRDSQLEARTNIKKLRLFSCLYSGFGRFVSKTNSNAAPLQLQLRNDPSSRLWKCDNGKLFALQNLHPSWSWLQCCPFPVQRVHMLYTRCLCSPGWLHTAATTTGWTRKADSLLLEIPEQHRAGLRHQT